MTADVVELDAAPPPVTGEAQRRRELATMKRRATGLLVVVTIAFALVTLLGDDKGLGGYLRALFESSMVGGLADWFAVTALFRRPLNLPIPHTAVIRERKDQFGATLGSFVQENFLSPDVLGSRVRGANVGRRVADWLATPENAATVARHGVEMAVGVADVIKDEDVHRAIEEQIRRMVDETPLAPWAGRTLRALTQDGRHQELLNAILNGAGTFLGQNRETLRARFGEQSPWWLPGAVEDRIFDRILDGVMQLIAAVNADPDHELRREFDTRVVDLIDRLEHSPDMLARGEDLKRELLSQPQLRDFASSIWTRAKAALREQAGDPESELRRRLAGALQMAGERIQKDPALLRRIDSAIESGARYIAEHFRDELAGLISGTIARWDGAQTSDRLELLLGRDLQFIRINGTVVGAMAGVAIHAFAEILG